MNQEMFEYIIENLQILRKNLDLKMKFVSIVAIIELLLTHRPDHARFNVEESINKQFKNKIALITYLYDNTVDYKVIAQEAGCIYSLRSDIAHGNFDELPKNLRKYYNLCRENGYTHITTYDKTSTLNLLISRTLKYMVIAFNMCLEDYTLLEIIKTT